MEMQQEIVDYYNKLAQNYDNDRFNNTYGRYIDYQEKKLVCKLLKGNDINKTVDMACGTGRFLEFARYGIDISGEMIKVAGTKFPECKLYKKSVMKTDFAGNMFATAFSFHLVMHLRKDDTILFLNEVNRILVSGGRFIFDFPSKCRRNITGLKKDNWHGANDYTLDEIKKIAENWRLRSYYGILFFPIHRFPKSFRKFLMPLDTLLCRSFLRKYASYIVVVLEKL